MVIAQLLQTTTLVSNVLITTILFYMSMAILTVLLYSKVHGMVKELKLT
jgi:hypothetical protein